MSKVFEHFKDQLEDNGPQHPSEMEPEDPPTSNCCDYPFTYPGYPESDICSKCGEHAGPEDDYYKDMRYDR